MKGLLDGQVASGAETIGHLAKSTRRAADELNRDAPQLAGLVRGLAEQIEGFGGISEIKQWISWCERLPTSLGASLPWSLALRHWPAFSLSAYSRVRHSELQCRSILTGTPSRTDRAPSMAHDHLNNSTLARSFSNVIADLF